MKNKLSGILYNVKDAVQKSNNFWIKAFML